MLKDELQKRIMYEHAMITWVNGGKTYEGSDTQKHLRNFAEEIFGRRATVSGVSEQAWAETPTTQSATPQPIHRRQ
jgi:hypothetical protein